MAINFNGVRIIGCAPSGGGSPSNNITTFETVTRKDTHKNAEGQITGTTERKEQARVEVNDIVVTYQCSKCLYEWNTKIQKRDVL